jgi:TPP-dependent pyruvate/acetoin dehydrogenase alpha subunit
MSDTPIQDALDPNTDPKRWMYASMLRIRRVEEVIAERYAEQEIRCPTHFCIGQEAPPAGVSVNLRSDDMVFSAHRSHGHYLSKGGSLKGMIAELYGRDTGCARGKGGSQHLIDLECGFMGSAPILASTISVGVGTAWGATMNGENRVVVIYFGDGATEEGTFHEAMNFAGTYKLPVVFVCENNQYSVHSEFDVRQPKGRAIKDIAPAHGMIGASGDGNDVDLVSELAREAVDRARSGGGPTLLELHTYRWKEHCGPNEDTALGYRSEEEVDHWKRRDPISNFEDRLLSDGLIDPAWQTALLAEIDREIEAAFNFAIQSPYPDLSELDTFVFPRTERVAQ